MKNNEYILISPENQIKKFIEENENTREILEAITPQLKKHFPNSKLSLEICNSLTWTTETKLLVNVNVS